MCQYSATTDNQRDARQGEDLVITRAPHQASNWLTAREAPGCAVCIPDTAILAVQVPGSAVRGATFRQMRIPVDGNHDFLIYLDGKKERIALNDLPKKTQVRVLQLYTTGNPAPPIPTVIGTRAVASANTEGELVAVSTGGGVRRNRLSRFFGSD